MKIKLGEYAIKDAQQRLKQFKDDLDYSTNEIIEQLVNRGSEMANNFNAMAPQSGREKSIIITDINETDHIGTISLYGKNAVYDEFGTGEEGASNPHPLKSEFGLNPYNSGPIVSKNIDKYGKHYWFYSISGNPYNNVNGIRGLTYGIPSGKQMYNTAKELRKEVQDITKNELNELIRSINNQG